MSKVNQGKARNPNGKGSKASEPDRGRGQKGGNGGVGGHGCDLIRKKKKRTLGEKIVKLPKGGGGNTHGESTCRFGRGGSHVQLEGGALAQWKFTTEKYIKLGDAVWGPLKNQKEV